METKSRYQVIGELEAQKREYMAEKESLASQLVAKKAKIKQLERQKSDTLLVLERQMEDALNELTNFEEQLADKKKLLDDLVESVDESLKRFSNQSSQS